MKDPRTLIAGMVACFVTVVVACTLVTLFSEQETVAAFVTPLIGFTGTTLALLATMSKLGGVDAKVEDVAGKVEYLANGGTDAKIRAGIADVLRPDLIDDAAADQIEADRVHRANGAAGPPA